ncbi:hypothetical protein EAF00_009375 [Botryotinia globosa]|nr:hypothetical protein EAF00_009375 [Botryotinia globosa]
MSMESKTSDARKQCLEFEAKREEQSICDKEETQPHSSFVSIAFGMLNNEINLSTTPNRPKATIRVRGSTTFNWKPIPFPYSCKAVKIQQDLA